MMRPKQHILQRTAGRRFNTDIFFSEHPPVLRGHFYKLKFCFLLHEGEPGLHTFDLNREYGMAVLTKNHLFVDMQRESLAPISMRNFTYINSGSLVYVLRSKQAVS
jgi:hypothetical protein